MRGMGAFLWNASSQKFDLMFHVGQLLVQSPPIRFRAQVFDAAAHLPRIELKALNLGDSFRLRIVNCTHPAPRFSRLRLP
jgi:hypothetical protein